MQWRRKGYLVEGERYHAKRAVKFFKTMPQQLVKNSLLDALSSPATNGAAKAELCYISPASPALNSQATSPLEKSWKVSKISPAMTGSAGALYCKLSDYRYFHELYVREFCK